MLAETFRSNPDNGGDTGPVGKAHTQKGASRGIGTPLSAFSHTWRLSHAAKLKRLRVSGVRPWHRKQPVETGDKGALQASCRLAVNNRAAPAATATAPAINAIFGS